MEQDNSRWKTVGHDQNGNLVSDDDWSNDGMQINLYLTPLQMLERTKKDAQNFKFKIQNLQKQMSIFVENIDAIEKFGAQMDRLPVLMRIKQDLDYLKGEGVTFRNMKSFWAQLNEKIEGKQRRKRKSRSKKLKQAYKDMSTRKPVSHPVKANSASDSENS